MAAQLQTLSCHMIVAACYCRHQSISVPSVDFDDEDSTYGGQAALSLSSSAVQRDPDRHHLRTATQLCDDLM